MYVTLLGTGAPAGLPRPGCPCAACARALGDEARAATSLLVDGVLLLDVTPGAALAAARAGQSLHGVRQVLLGHAQEDRGPELPTELPAPVRLPDGRDLTLLSGHRVRAVPVDGPGTGYAVTGPDGGRLLYLPPGAAPARENAPGGPPFDLCVLDVAARPDGLALLRETGAAGLTTDVVAVHLDHDVPPGQERRRRLAAAGARAEPDGATLVAGDYQLVPDLPRRTLVLGGARSGKSAEAERRLAAFPGVEYVATGGRREGDAEWAERVAAHRGRRPPGWTTRETCDLVPLLAREDGPPLLIDCLALWLTDAMDAAGAWDGERWSSGPARAELAARTSALAAAVRATRRTLVAVSNETGSGVVPATPAGRRFRDELGRLNAAIAAECEQVLLTVAGTTLPLRA
ncbi:bifunctional adenosylcobinamide kinase/adenosylcobinamide-phosphate guanylyltransferase [Streptomyces sp. DSM 44917]|uniref:Adenosylcobinamide kinase n=1 Tax=Streptomyces boetiae TaxID=3075541 RepID=A0ABU2LFX4_9ACTN|nr:bifunctional adenosylcobinamide kinase/adenosylcobinamide-phosphate guanylyltransferase [Streptomyces sp. DSM 44917]MDT0310488.1 bifunctional adenosylcobinamide kinase/adenosylcobinamide-phosphate guanylyltransferase [Streptomyces sp. DSM 44917]